MDGPNDIDALNLTKAIRQQESGGDFERTGKSGEFGAYQFTPPTWKAYAKDVLGDENAEMTPENQNKVAYTKIKGWKDKGYNVGQIASMWNAGEGRPDAYKEDFKGTNEYGVSYDVPAYANAVRDFYHHYKGEGGGGTNVANAEGGRKTFIEEIGGGNPASATVAPTEQVGLAGQAANKVVGLVGGAKVNDRIATADSAKRALKGKKQFGQEAITETDYSKLSPEAVARLEAKGVPTTQDAQRKEMAGQIMSGAPSVKETLKDAGKLGTSIGTVLGVGAAAKGISGALKGAGALKHPIVEAAITRDMPMKVFNGLSAADKYRALEATMKGLGSLERKAIEKAMQQLLPAAEKELGLAASTASKVGGKIKGLIGSGIVKTAKTALAYGGLREVVNTLTGKEKK
jgi:hypothetical protein